MKIRHVIVATIAAAGFSFAASAAPIVQQAPVTSGSQLTLVHHHHASAGHHHHHHHHHGGGVRSALRSLVLVVNTVRAAIAALTLSGLRQP